MTAAARLEVAQEQVEKMSARDLKRYADNDEVWRLAYRVGVPFFKLQRIIKRERFKRGLLKMEDLSPQDRRELVDLSNLDLKALAAGPIMDAGEIYLPAGKLSMMETRRREQGNILPDDEAA